jgi:GNAT superfamily N-acetyltransferase
MDLAIVPLDPDHIDALTGVMTRSFDDDARRHLGTDRGGPPGYDTGEFLRRYGLDPGASAFEAVLDGRPVGAVISFPRPDGHHVVGCLFTDPEVQRRGIGSALMRHVEDTHPGSSWTLETPDFALSNHRFYAERCGYRKVDERDDPDDADGVGKVFVYRKVL